MSVYLYGGFRCPGFDSRSIKQVNSRKTARISIQNRDAVRFEAKYFGGFRSYELLQIVLHLITLHFTRDYLIELINEHMEYRITEAR